MVSVSMLDLIAGALTFSTVILGYIMAGITLRLYLKKKVLLLGLSVLLFIGLTSPWLGVSTVFLLTILGQSRLNDTTYVFLYSWAVPLAGTTWNYITATLWKNRPKAKYYILSFYILLDIVFLYEIYIQHEFIVHSIPGSIFLDSEFIGLSALLIYIYVLSIIAFVSPIYFYTAWKSTSHKTKVRTALIGFGGILYSIVAIVDGVFGLTSVGILIFIRSLLVLTIFILYLAYTSPKWFINWLEKSN